MNIENDFENIRQHQVFDPFFLDALLIAAHMLLNADTLVVSMDLTGVAGAAFADHHSLTMTAI